MHEKRPLAVILTALPVEAKAVCSMINVQRIQTLDSGVCCEHGEFTADDKTICHVAVAEIGMGSDEALLETHNVVKELRPDCLFFVGVAGGVKDMQVGNVVIGDKVYGYEQAKIEDRSISTGMFGGIAQRIGLRNKEGSRGVKMNARPNLEHPHKTLISLAKIIARNGTWTSLCKHGGARKIPTAKVAPIATGGKVLATTKSEFYELIKRSYNDTSAIEMEGIGFLRAVRDIGGVPAIVIRGISDLLDDKKKSDDSGSQEIASAHAAAFAFELLHQFFLPQGAMRKRMIQPDTSAPDGTRIPTTEFDETIRDGINELFKGDDFQEVQKKIFELSDQKEGSDIGKLLCSPNIEIESAVGWLNQAAAEVVQAMPKYAEGERRRKAFKDIAEKILGWLVLRTVDPAWVEQHGSELRKKQGARLHMRKCSDSGVEIIVARNFKDRSRFEGNSQAVKGCTAIGGFVTESGIEPEANKDALFRQIYKQICQDEITGEVKETHTKKLSVRLKSHAISGLRYYLTVPLDDLVDALKENDLYEFQGQFSYLKLILLRMDDGESALLVDDDELHELILTFFLRVIEEQR